MSNAALAIDLVEEASVEDLQQDLFLTFQLYDENYGVSISYVTEIIGIQKISNVPDMPAYIRGIINLRGRVIPVMDVRHRFGLPERAYDERTCVIVVEVNSQTTGLVVDRVNEVVEIPAGKIEAAPNHSKENSHIGGIGKVGDEVKILLNIETLVQDIEAESTTGLRTVIRSLFGIVQQIYSLERDYRQMDSSTYVKKAKSGFSKLITSENWQELPEPIKEKILVQLAEYKREYISTASRWNAV